MIASVRTSYAHEYSSTLAYKFLSRPFKLSRRNLLLLILSPAIFWLLGMVDCRVIQDRVPTCLRAWQLTLPYCPVPYLFL